MELMPDYASRVVGFGAFEVDLRAGELHRNGRKLKIQNQPFQILAMLLERPGEVITRDEMRARLWPAETFVDFDHGLNSAVRRLRDALGDSAEAPIYIETVGRRGYRFVFPAPTIYPHNGNGNGIGLAGAHAIEVPEAPIAAPKSTAPSSRPVRLVVVAAAGLLVLVAAAVLVVFGRGPGEKLEQWARTIRGAVSRDTVVVQRRLTANPADMPVTSQALSADGRYLAYTDKTGLYVKQIATGETHLVKLPPDFLGLVQSWFPDNTHILLSELRSNVNPYGIWVMSILGGSPRQLAAEGIGARVSPDGSKIVFVKDGVGRNELWLMQSDGEEQQRILRDTSTNEVHFSLPAWAPGGKWLAYVRNVLPLYNAADPTGTRKTIELLEVSSRRVEVIETSKEIEGALGWSPEGDLLYSLRDASAGEDEFALWRVSIDGNTARARGRPTKVATGRGWATDMSVAHSAHSLTLRTMEPNADAYVAEVVGITERLTPKRITLDDRADYPFGWTGDSHSILMLSDRDGPIHLYKQPLDQIQPELLVGGDEVLGIPRLGPSGNEVFYLQMQKNRGASDPVKIMRAPLAGGPSRAILEAPGIWNYQCAQPPANVCLHSPTDAEFQRFVAFDPNTGTSHEMEFLRISARPERPNWSLSSDGAHLALLMAPAGGDFAVKIRTLKDGATQTIPLRGWPETIGVDWARDGKSLWIAGKRSRSPASRDCAVLQVGLNGKITVRFEDQSLCFLAAIPSPDGYKLALPVTLPNSSNVWLVENF